MSRRTVFGSLLGLVFLVNLARVVFAPLLEPLGTALDANDAALGTIATLAWLGSALPRIPTGYLLTHISRSVVILASSGILAVAAVATSLANSVPAVMVGAFLMGLASGSYFIAGNPLASELFPDRVGSTLGIHGTASQLAAVSAPAIVVAALGVGDWRTVFRAMAVAAVVSGIAFALTARRTEMPDAGAEDTAFLAAARHQWRIVLAGVAVIGVTGLVWNGLFNFYVKYFLAKGLTGAQANQLLTIAFGAGVPAFFVSGRLADRLPVLPYILSIIGGFLLSVYATTLLSGYLGLAVLSAVLGYVIHSLFPAVDTYLLGSLPDHHRGSAYAVYSGTMMIIQASGSTIVGSLSSAGYSFETIFTWLVAVLAAVLLGLTGLYVDGQLPTGARA
ncbi:MULTISPECIES: MFS transporter [Halomicrobium]|uniref:Major facilitator superfamily MFS_1 n=2 Tax=Halomicrobium mukohataei TaxID=57705 RepID=C7P1R1_HALMD|nr:MULTISPECIES: MFS transporter [Halomicrobium]ACV49151.1 major facilitator superfamily MFS_1 [Halomicrobium mukohataei DSM 12286]QCD64561.1 MFS transporter [Halomicrobium mukohataei]QFR19368.1 MFS transporter [Halomicrobium sp. ZPS1]